MFKNFFTKNNILSLIVVAISFLLISFFISVMISNNHNNGAVEGITSIIYISPTGNDSNAGTQSAPYKTFAKAVSKLVPGTELQIMGGTYTEKLVINKSGNALQPVNVSNFNGQKVIIDMHNGSNSAITIPNGTSYVNVSNIEVQNVSAICVYFSGQNLTIRNLIVHNCTDHGLYVDGQNILVSSNTVYKATTSNSARTASSGWGSGIKLRVGADNVTIENNTSYNNYGEGIAATRAKNTTIRGNRVYDNFAVNIYIDNSINTTVNGNFMSCGTNTGFERDGKPASAVSIGEEYYDGWGAQLKNVTITNNVMAYCNHSINWFGADVTGGGLDTALIANNTMWGTIGSEITMANEPNNKSIRIVNNIIQQPSNSLCVLESASGITFNNNFWVNSSPPSECRNSADKTGDPKLAGTPDRNSVNNYKLTSTSSAINAGLRLDNVTTDYTNVARYTGSSPSSDIGAFEFDTSGGVVPVPTPTPVPVPTPTPTPTPVPTPTPTPVPTPTPTPTPPGEPQEVPPPSPTPTPVPNPTPTPVPTPTPQPTVCRDSQYLVNGKCYPIGCRGDYNKDGKVNNKDFESFVKNYKKGKIDCSLDIAGNDCVINLQDLVYFAKVYGTNSCKI
ncbi:MAG: right-handed parallel beta-helix repeat-containing protein [Candidatus Dojkabacteria bacterium]